MGSTGPLAQRTHERALEVPPQGDFELDLALRHMDLAADLVAGRTFDVRPDEVPPLAVASGCSAYDCQYVALAERLDVPLVTHDRRVLQAFPDRAVLPLWFLRGA